MEHHSSEEKTPRYLNHSLAEQSEHANPSKTQIKKEMEIQPNNLESIEANESDLDSRAGLIERQNGKKQKLRLWSTKSIAVQMIMALLLILATFLLFFSQKYFPQICSVVFVIFAWLKNLPEPIRTLTFWAVSFTIQILGIPIACLIMMIICYSYANFVAGYLVCISTSLMANLFMYLMMREKDSSQTPEILPDNDRGFLEFQVESIKETVLSHPYIAGCIVRSLHMPDYGKMFIQTRFHLTIPQIVVPVVAIEMLNVFLYCLVGNQIQNQFELISSKEFSKKSTVEKIMTLTIYILAIIQVTIIVSSLIYTNKKYKEYKESKSTPENEIEHDQSF